MAEEEHINRVSCVFYILQGPVDNGKAIALDTMLKVHD